MLKKYTNVTLTREQEEEAHRSLVESSEELDTLKDVMVVSDTDISKVLNYELDECSDD